MTQPKIRCLILACGNTLRSDDGVGPWLAAWAEEEYRTDPGICVISRQQWTPDLAEEIAGAETVLFIDCSVESDPGSVQLTPVDPSAVSRGLAAHHLGAAELLALASELYPSTPAHSLLLTVGADCTELGEGFSSAVKSALPDACDRLERAIRRLLT
jgi:hydrogenase maturation protease